MRRSTATHRLTGRVLSAALFAGVFVGSAPNAGALTLTNREAAEVRVTEIRGAQRQTHQVAPMATLTGICARGCILKLEDGSEWQLDGSERVSLEGKLVYYDGPETGPGAGAVERPRTPAAPSAAPRSPLLR